MVRALPVGARRRLPRIVAYLCGVFRGAMVGCACEVEGTGTFTRDDKPNLVCHSQTCDFSVGTIAFRGERPCDPYELTRTLMALTELFCKLHGRLISHSSIPPQTTHNRKPRTPLVDCQPGAWLVGELIMATYGNQRTNIQD